MAEEDEDVLFEGHPLTVHLREHGITDFAVEGRPLLDAQPVAQASGQGMWSQARMACSTLLQRLGILSSSVQGVECRQLVQQVQQTGVMLEDDRYFVSSMTEEFCWPTGGSSLRSVLQVTVPCAAYFWSTNLFIATCTLAAASMVYDLGVAYRRHCRMKQLSRLTSVCRNLRHLVNKLLKLIQENELIIWGFTMAKTGCTQSFLENHKLLSSSKKWGTMPGLRAVLVEALAELVTTFCQATRTLCACCPLVGKFDCPSHYVALDENLLKDCINVEHTLYSLKKLHELYLVVQSEFFRRLALCFCPELWPTGVAQDLGCIWQLLPNIHDQCSQLCISLQREYTIFYHRGVCAEMDNKPKEIRTRSTDHRLTNVYVAVHSTVLHLRLMLERVAMAEEELETWLSSEQSLDAEARMERIVKLREVLNDTLTQLATCKSCCEEGVDRLDKLDQNAEDGEDGRGQDAGYLDIMNSSDHQEAIRIDLNNYVVPVEDEVFEGVSRQDRLLADTDIDPGTEPRAREKVKSEEEFCKRVMQELKVVLVNKAEEWKEREEKAIKKKMFQNQPAESMVAEAGTSGDYTVPPDEQSALVMPDITDPVLAGSCFSGRFQAATEIDGNISQSQNTSSVPSASNGGIRTKDDNDAFFHCLATELPSGWPLPRLKSNLPPKRIKKREILQNSSESGLAEPKMQVFATPELKMAMQIVAKQWAVHTEEDTFGDSDDGGE